MKANSNLAVLQTFAQAGCGFDIVSGGELQRVLAAGGDAARVVFSGVGKTRTEMAQALQAGVACFNVESDAEIGLLSDGLFHAFSWFATVLSLFAVGELRRETRRRREQKQQADVQREEADYVAKVSRDGAVAKYRRRAVRWHAAPAQRPKAATVRATRSLPPPAAPVAPPAISASDLRAWAAAAAGSAASAVSALAAASAHRPVAVEHQQPAAASGYPRPWPQKTMRPPG